MRNFNIAIVSKVGLAALALILFQEFFVSEMPESNVKAVISALMPAGIVAICGFVAFSGAKYWRNGPKEGYVSMYGFLRIVGIILFGVAGLSFILNVITYVKR